MTELHGSKRAEREGHTAMNTSPTSRTGVVRDQRSALHHLTDQQFLNLGTHQVVYLRSGIHDGKPLFVLYGADGRPLALVDAVETAAEMAAGHGLAFVSIH
jgi:hypothetical protein